MCHRPQPERDPDAPAPTLARPGAKQSAVAEQENSISEFAGRAVLAFARKLGRLV